MAIGRSFKITGKCSHHKWMRWVKRGAAMGPVKVGLKAPKLDDYCAVCGQLRSLVEGVV